MRRFRRTAPWSKSQCEETKSPNRTNVVRYNFIKIYREKLIRLYASEINKVMFFLKVINVASKRLGTDFQHVIFTIGLSEVTSD